MSEAKKDFILCSNLVHKEMCKRAYNSGYQKGLAEKLKTPEIKKGNCSLCGCEQHKKKERCPAKSNIY